MLDYGALDRYLGVRYPPPRRLASVAVKWALPVRLLAVREVVPDSADIVLLHPHPASAKRHERLARSLERHGLSVRHECVPGALDLLVRRHLHPPRAGWSRIPRQWRLQAAFAAWLAAKFRPRVLVTFMDDSLHTPFLRDAVSAHGGALVNVSHAMCWPSMDFSMCDADWCLLWGRRSHDNLASAPVRFGNCRTLTIGSIYLGGREGATPRSLPQGRPPRLLWIGQDCRSAHSQVLERDAAAFARLLAAHPEYEAVVRPHPRDRGELMRELGPALPRARWVDAATPLAGILDEVDIAISSFSSGLVDAAARALPVIAFSTSGLAEAIGLREAGLPVVGDERSLAEGVGSILADYGAASRSALRLAREHLFELDDATERCAGVLETLARGGDPARSGFPVGQLGHKEP